MATIAEEGEKARVRLADPISIYFESAGVGKTMKGSKLRLSWHLCFGPYGREHIVDVTVSTRSGKREVRTRVPSPPRIWERTAPECVAMARHPRVAEEKARPGRPCLAPVHRRGVQRKPRARSESLWFLPFRAPGSPPRVVCLLLHTNGDVTIRRTTRTRRIDRWLAGFFRHGADPHVQVGVREGGVYARLCARGAHRAAREPRLRREGARARDRLGTVEEPAAQGGPLAVRGACFFDTKPLTRPLQQIQRPVVWYPCGRVRHGDAARAAETCRRKSLSSSPFCHVSHPRACFAAPLPRARVERPVLNSRCGAPMVVMIREEQED